MVIELTNFERNINEWKHRIVTVKLVVPFLPSSPTATKQGSSSKLRIFSFLYPQISLLYSPQQIIIPFRMKKKIDEFCILQSESMQQH